MKLHTKYLILGLAVLPAALAIAGCGSNSSSGTTANSESLQISDPWTRVTAPDQMNGAVYMTITSDKDDRLTKATVPATVAGSAELHETTMGKSSMSGSSGEMSMKPVSAIDLKANQPLELKPGGYHIMLMDLVKPIDSTDKIQVTLTFAKAGERTVTAYAKR